ncbi:MAG TPA: methyltransferase domain-containing protein, partial [Solirubrobacterales bacterium]|nr:methyltransferase domain-containing protein [Solirubrobacterales bacterium]
ERSQGFFWNRVRWELVESYMPKGPFDLVDVGAGPGFLGDYLAEHRPDARYAFVEPIEGLERSLIDRFGASANRRDGDYKGASILTMLDVLEHIEDDRGFLTDLANKSDPGTTLLLTVPALPALWSNWDVLLGHYRRYTKASLASAAELTGFEVIERSYLFPELIPLGMWRRMKERAGSADAGSDAEFPDLSDPLNETLYRLASGTKATRRLWPAGTSLFAVLRRSG